MYADDPTQTIRPRSGTRDTGVIETAAQDALQREVALKRLSAPHDKAAYEALLREARLTSRLQHPNIVPIHALVEDDEKGPVVVMKRLEGIPWREHMQRNSAAQEHVRVALGLCFALEYAHSRRILHLDVKPDNVVVGDFGEVWLVDWGVALDLENDPPRKETVGTPAYMAPEMVDPAELGLTERTDVYLVGASLFEALYGTPPHRRPDIQSSLDAAFEPVRIPGDSLGVGAELTSVIARALAPDPSDRFESIAVLRKALQDVLEHEHAETLVGEALSELVEGGEALDFERLDAIEARIQSALTLWSESPRGLAALDRVRAQRVRVCVEEGDLLNAERFLFSMRAPSEELHARVETLRSIRDAEIEAHVQVQRNRTESALTENLGWRQLATGLAVALFTVMPAVSYSLDPGGSPAPTPRLLLYASLTTVVWLAMVTVRRDRFFSNHANRAATLSVSVSLLCVVLNRAVSLQVGDDPVAILQREMLLVAGLFAAQSSLHRVFTLIALAYAGEWVVSSFVPELTRHLYNAGALGGAVALSILWRGLSDAEQD